MSDNVGMGSLDVHQLDRGWVRLQPSTLASVGGLLTDPDRLVWVDMEYEQGVTEELLADSRTGACPSRG
jgi:hypothetical protein